MSGGPTPEEDKEISKALPLDLAKSQISSARPMDGKGSFAMTGGTLRGMRVLTQASAGSTSTTAVSGSALIVPQAVIKQDGSRTQIATILTSNPNQGPQASGGVTQRPTQITLSTAPMVTGSVVSGAYHVPRGAAVVANLAAPRSNVGAVRTPMVVATQTALQVHSLVRSPKTPSPTGTAWLTTTSANGSQIKGAPTVLSAPVRGTTITGKPQLVARAQVPQAVSTIRPGTILHSAITLGQPGQIHSFKTGHTTTGIQTLGNTMTIAQVLPSRTQAVVYNANTSVPFTSAPRLTVASTGSTQRHASQPRSLSQVPSTRLALPVTLSATPSPRLVPPPSTVALQSANSKPTTTTCAARLVSSSNRLSVAAPPTQGVLTQPRITTLNLQSLVPTTGHLRNASQGKLITQSTQTPQSSSTTQASSAPSVPITALATYSLAGSTYYGGYPRSYPASQHNTAQVSAETGQRQAHVHAVNQPMRFNPMMLVDRPQKPAGGVIESMEQTTSPQPAKMPSSPRPSILRKRDYEGSPIKAARNLSPLLITLPKQAQSTVVTQPPPQSPPSRPDSSGGSTTISATSSPGIADVNEDSLPEIPTVSMVTTSSVLKKEPEESKLPPAGVSPRKKPRKQLLTSNNELEEPTDEMQFISDSQARKEADSDEDARLEEPKDGAPEGPSLASTALRKPATASLLNSYRQSWKATHNHYLRYCDVKPKDERRPTIMDLANQPHVQDKVNGWKIYHLSTQMEELAESEQSVYEQLTELLQCTESAECSNFDKDMNRINELIKGNLQRIKIINDGMVDAKTQMMKIFDHKNHVTDIISRCASKRNFKKRDKS